MSRRALAFRRYPALAFLVAAGLLAMLLPSSLRIPLAGPSTAAEVAPTPGEGSQAGDLSALGEGSSGGLGYGRGAAGLGSTTTTTPDDGDGGSLRRRDPRGKRCVGDPPRQTEDPLSPPCVAYFDGDNGGATSRGVTASEVVVVFIVSGNDGRFVDYTEPIRGDELAVDRDGKVFTRYFNERYQLYNRRVRAYGFHAPGGTAGSTLEQVRADVVRIDSEKRPFAVVALTDYRATVFAREAAARGMVAAVYEGFERSAYQQVAPFLISFAPDIEDHAGMVAQYVCTKLAGRAARHAGSLVDKSGARRFGIVYSDDPEEPFFPTLRRAVKDQLARRCSLSPAAEQAVTAPARTGGSQDEAPAMSTMQRADVTTVVPIVSGSKRAALTRAAAGLGYEPEWLVPALAGMDDANNARSYEQTQWRRAFGLTTDSRRHGVVELQPWAMAYKDACPDCDLPAGNPVVTDYDVISLLFYGLQSAGPRLTPTSFDRGLHAIPQRGSPDPYKPAAYFAPGNYSFVKDAMEMWWDSVEKGEGQSRAGCYRLVADGARSRAQDWTGDDSDAFDGTGPCQGPKGRLTGG